MKQKLLIVTDNFLPQWDGVTRFLVEVIPKLSKSYDVTVLAPDFSGSSIFFPDVKIFRFPLSMLVVNNFQLAYPQYKNFEPYIKEADIVWTQGIGSLGSSAIYIAKRYKKPLIAYIHSIEWALVEKSVPGPLIFKQLASLLTQVFANWLYNKCDILMMPTQEVADIFESKEIETVKILVPLGVNCKNFEPSENKADSKKALGIKPEEIVIGYCGRISRDKDVITLYKAFEWINKKCSNVKLLIVGPGNSDYMTKFDSKENIIVTGAKDNVVDYYQAMDIFVLPSLTETTSLATLEAMACGCCIVSTKVGIAQDIIKNGENGLFFPKRNDLILKKKLKWLVNHPDIIEMYSKRARVTVIKHYSWTETIKAIEDVLAKF